MHNFTSLFQRKILMQKLIFRCGPQKDTQIIFRLKIYVEENYFRNHSYKIKLTMELN